MSRLSTLAVAIMAAVVVGAAPAGDRPGGAGGILLFGARWCAPCMAEYRDLPGLVEAAAPDRITLAWIDRAIDPPAQVRRDVQSLPVEQARRLAQGIAGEGYGLPFSVMFDPAGRACAVWRAPLRASDLAAMRAQCARSRT